MGRQTCRTCGQLRRGHTCPGYWNPGGTQTDTEEEEEDDSEQETKKIKTTVTKEAKTVIRQEIVPPAHPRWANPPLSCRVTRIKGVSSKARSPKIRK